MWSEKLRGALKQVPGLGKLRDELDLLRKHRRFRPDRTPIVGTLHSLYADPREPRGRALLRNGASGQPALKRIWCRALQTLSPDIALDVGANYGEFLFRPVYNEKTQVLGIEADPSLLPYLERSRAVHPCGEQIEILGAAAGAEEGFVELFVDPAWSGRSSVVRRPAGPTVPVRVPQVTVDGALEQRRMLGTLVFKLDVESYEPEVLAGMEETLRRSPTWVGIMEFDGPSLVARGQCPATVLERCLSRGTVYSVDKAGHATHVRGVADGAEALCATDLVLFSEPALVDILGGTR